MNQSTTKNATFNFTLKAASGYSATATHNVSPGQYGRICAILNEAGSQPTNTRCTYSGMADYDQCQSFHGIAGDAA